MVMIPQNYVGCDVAKNTLDFFDPHSGRLRQIRNQPKAIGSFVAGLDGDCDFVVMEATGVHDRLLRHALAEAGIGFARRNPMQMRRFAQADGQRAKTDSIDARMLSRFGERYAYGHIREEDRDMIVSAGLGFSDLPLRINAPAEIVLVELGSADE